MDVNWSNLGWLQPDMRRLKAMRARFDLAGWPMPMSLATVFEDVCENGKTAFKFNESR
jgi:hypothetical protein